MTIFGQCINVLNYKYIYCGVKHSANSQTLSQIDTVFNNLASYTNKIYILYISRPKHF